MAKLVVLDSCSSEALKLSVIVDDPSNQLIVGNVYYFSGEVCTFTCETIIGCYSIRELKDTSDPVNTIFSGTYGKYCELCNQANANSYVFGSCNDKKTQVLIPKNQFPPTPVVGDVFLLSLYISDGSITQVQLIGCFEYVSSSLDITTNVTLEGFTAQTSCQDCLNNSPVLYEVTECITSVVYYINFPTNQYEKHLVTFTDSFGIDQFCGIVSTITSGVANGFLITDLGIPGETGILCDDCLDNISEKKKLVNCLDGTEEIVWASVLFLAGNATHLQTVNGCYEISPDVVPSGETVTITELANYDPQGGCEECLECYGILYNYITCEQIDYCRPFNIIDFTSSGQSTREFVIDSNDYSYITLNSSQAISKIDLNTQSVVSTSASVVSCPFGIDIDEVNNVIVVSDNCSYEIKFFDSNDLTLFTGITINSNLGRDVYFDSINSSFYVITNSGGAWPNVKVLSGLSYNTMSLVTEFGSTSDYYYGILRVGSILYLLNVTAKKVDLYDVTTFTYIDSIGLPVIPSSFDYDGMNQLYVSFSNENYYIKVDLTTSGLSTINYVKDCAGGDEKIKINTSVDKFYITNFNCNKIYEFQLSTDTLLKEYSLSDYLGGNLNQPYGIDIDTSGNTWFGSNSYLFQLECITDFYTGTSLSYEYLTTGKTFYNPIISACCEITEVLQVNNNYNESYFSMVSYDTCAECTGTTHESFYCSVCTSNLGGYSIMVAPVGQYNVGDFVKSHYGNSNWLCFEIIDYYSTEQYGTGFSIFESEGMPAYPTCEDCQATSQVGLTLINCNTLVAQNVNVSLSDWVTISGLFGNQIANLVVTDANGTCYQIVNTCPIDDVYPLFEVSNFYINQLFCRLANRINNDPISAGTEYFSCQICCPCESGGTITSVVVPHATWTDPRGRAIVLLDTIVLGGPNGLNS